MRTHLARAFDELTFATIGRSKLSEPVSKPPNAVSKPGTKRKHIPNNDERPPSRNTRPETAKTTTPRRKSGRDEQPPARETRSTIAKTTSPNREPEDEMGDQLQDDSPSSASSDDEANKLPSQMMLSRIRVYWDLKSIFDILPKHSYDPYTQKQSAPFIDYPRLLRALFKLAITTKHRADEAEEAMERAFEYESDFDEDGAVRIMRRLAKRFKKGKGVVWTRMLTKGNYESGRDDEGDDKMIDTDHDEGENNDHGDPGTTRITRHAKKTREVTPTHAEPLPRITTITDDISNPPSSASPSHNANPPLLPHSGTTTSLSAILNTLYAERDTLRTRNETLFSIVAQNTARRPPRTQQALNSITYQHMIADSDLIQAELELNRVRQQRSHAYANHSGSTEELEARVVRAEIEVIRQKEIVLELTARRLGIETRQS